jgi:hypothetical protein
MLGKLHHGITNVWSSVKKIYSKAPTLEAKSMPYSSCRVLAVSSSLEWSSTLETNSADKMVGCNLGFFLATAFS